jgi:hypothetical protein
MTPKALRHLQDLRQEILHQQPTPQTASTETVTAAA